MVNADGSQHGAVKFTPETGDKICSLVADDGMTISLAAEFVGVHRNTVNLWTREFPAFGVQFAQARATAVRKKMAQINAGGVYDWRAAAWWISRVAQDDYPDPTQRNEHTGKDGGPIESVTQAASPDDHAAIAAAILRRQSRKDDAT